MTLPKEGIVISRNRKQADSLGEDFMNERIVDYHRYINEVNERRMAFSSKHHIPFRPYYRSDSQIKHDTFLRELILSSRRIFKKDEIRTFNEVKYFGLTLDELLIKYDGYNKSITTTYPTFFRPSFLLNKLVKLLPIKTPDYKKAFIKAVSSRGFNKDPQKSVDIIKVVSYLKKCGIDNESVLLNLISEKLFMDKFHQESSKEDFNGEKFFESEMNTLLSKKESEVLASKKKLSLLEEVTRKDKEEKEKLRIENELKESNISLLQTAVSQLNDKIKKLEDRSMIKVVEPQINFEAAEKQSALDSITIELQKEKRKNLTLINEQRKILRKEHIFWRIFWWRFRSFIWIIGLPIVFLTLYYCLKNSQYFPENPAEKSLDAFLSSFIVSRILGLITIIYQAILIAIFSSKFIQTNKSKFVEQLEIPESLMELYE